MNGYIFENFLPAVVIFQQKTSSKNLADKKG